MSRCTGHLSCYKADNPSRTDDDGVQIHCFTTKLYRPALPEGSAIIKFPPANDDIWTFNHFSFTMRRSKWRWWDSNSHEQLVPTVDHSGDQFGDPSGVLQSLWPIQKWSASLFSHFPLSKGALCIHLSYIFITGLAGFEPAYAAVKVLCLTAWR